MQDVEPDHSNQTSCAQDNALRQVAWSEEEFWWMMVCCAGNMGCCNFGLFTLVRIVEAGWSQENWQPRSALLVAISSR